MNVLIIQEFEYFDKDDYFIKSFTIFFVLINRKVFDLLKICALCIDLFNDTTKFSIKNKLLTSKIKKLCYQS